MNVECSTCKSHIHTNARTQGFPAKLYPDHPRVCVLTCVWGGVEWGGGCNVLSCPGSSWGWGHAPRSGVPAVPQPLLTLPTLPLHILHGPVGTLTHKTSAAIYLSFYGHSCVSSANVKWTVIVWRFSSQSDHSKHFHTTCHIHSHTHTGRHTVLCSIHSYADGRIGFNVLPKDICREKPGVGRRLLFLLSYSCPIQTVDMNNYTVNLGALNSTGD